DRAGAERSPEEVHDPVPDRQAREARKADAVSRRSDRLDRARGLAGEPVPHADARRESEGPRAAARAREARLRRAALPAGSRTPERDEEERAAAARAVLNDRGRP